MSCSRHILQVFVGQLSSQYEVLTIEVSKVTSSLEIIACICQSLGFSNPNNYELAEVVGYPGGQECKERRLGAHEIPVAVQLLWPQSQTSDITHENDHHEYRFCLREKSSSDSFWAEPSQLDSQLIKDYFYKFLYQPKDKEYPDLCQLTNLNEQSLLENLRARFQRGHIYTYVGSILISVNPFKYYPIYNPKYVKLYQNHRLGELPPHIFAIADVAYHSMLKQRKNQCIVISGESGSGKTEATLFLLHHLTMLSQKGTHGSGVEQTILSSGPVLEAFGNAKTAHNNNSSRFGKFIQVSYKDNGLVQGACVQKYLLEKSRICSQARNERSYHVFYYLLAGASNQERQTLQLLKPSEYFYLNQSSCYTIEGCDEQYEFVRLKQSMEMVGFSPDKQQILFAVLSSVLLLGNIEFSQKKSTYNHDESVIVRNAELASTISWLLGVSEDTLASALISKKAIVHGEVLVINYRLPEALAARDALAKCLYGALFDWIVLQVNYSLISLKESAADHPGNSIGVLDIFGFEDFGNHNRFEQFCINFANEHLQHYFNQHVFEYEQEEYRREGISWTNIGFTDNIDCLSLIQGKPNGLLCILDDQCSFPGATNETFLQKINTVHKSNAYYEIPQRRENAFIIKHYAGKVKYKVDDIREKNLDLMRPELISVLKNSRFTVVRELAGADPVAVFRWAILRAFFRAVNAFQAPNKGKSKGIPDHRKSKQKIGVDSTRILTAIENTQTRLKRTRHTRSRSRSHGTRTPKNLKSVKALVQRTQNLTSQTRLGGSGGSRKSAQTVTGQFQISLQALMEALNRANPYFIRCIKSNASKEANTFDNELVQRQLRYTGMLETVRIRQAGFNVRMMFEEFIQHYRILLPKGLLSSQSDVRDFLLLMQLDRSEYQIGKSKIFMRESQKQKLDALLHQTILSRIVVIQRWYRSRLQRTHFLKLRTAVVKIQAQARCWLAQQLANNMRVQHHAAICIQKMWRGYRVRAWYKAIRYLIVRLQARIKGSISRQHFECLLKAKRDTVCAMESLGLEVSRDHVSPNSPARNSSLDPPNRDVEILGSSTPPNRNSLNSFSARNRNSLGSVSSVGNELDPSNGFALKGFLLDGSGTPPDKSNEASAAAPSAYEGVVARARSASLNQRVSAESVTTRSSYPTPDSASSDQVNDVQSRGSPGSPFKLAPQVVPRRRSAVAHRKFYLQQSEDVESPENPNLRRFSSNFSPLSPSEPRPSLRRMSETSVHLPKRQLGLTRTIRRSDEYVSGRSSPPASSAPQKPEPAVDATASSKTLPKMKSFRHRPYQKVPEGSDSKMDPGKPHSSPSDQYKMASIFSPQSVSDQESAAATATKFPRFKRPFKGFLIKPEGNTSEGDETSAESSCPATPTDRYVQTCLLPDRIDLRPAPKDSKKHKGVLGSDLIFSSSSRSYVKDEAGSYISPPINCSLVKSEDIKKVLASSHHNLKSSQLKKGEICSFCEKPFTKFFVNQGFKCTGCRKVFHSDCVRGSSHIACLFVNGSRASPAPRDLARPGHTLKKHDKDKNWSLTRTSQFIDRNEEVIKDIYELLALEEFITRKIYKMESEQEASEGLNWSGVAVADTSLGSWSVAAAVGLRERKDSQVDQLFSRSLKAFKGYLVSAYSVASQSHASDGRLVLKYKDLISNFEREMNALCKEPTGDAAFPITMGVNAFRGFLDEFVREKTKLQPPKVDKKRKRNRRKKKNKKNEISYGMHTFIPILVNIYTQCEVCNSILWLSSNALSCQKCKVTCHQKCLNKVDATCNANSTIKAVVVGAGPQRRRGSSQSKDKPRPPAPLAEPTRRPKLGRVFGHPLETLVSEEDKIPPVIERIIRSVELFGIYTEGLYRKSGVTSKIKEVKHQIDSDPEKVTFEDTPIHVLTSILKSFLRELPEPLLTYDAYDPLLHASALSDANEMFQSTLKVIDRLPKVNYDLLERLIFHLARIAQYENYNRMSCNSLAIVFTPCIVRSPRAVPVHDSLSDISKQTQAIELLLSRQLNKVFAVLRNIETVDKESISAGDKLNSLRASKMRSIQSSSAGVGLSVTDGGGASAHSGPAPKLDPRDALAVYKLEEQLQDFEEQKCRLTFGLTELVRGSSEEDLLSTDLSHAGSFEDLAACSARTAPVVSLSLDAQEVENWPERRPRRRLPRPGPDEDRRRPPSASSFSEDTVMV